MSFPIWILWKRSKRFLGQSAWPELMLPRNHLTSKNNNDPSYQSVKIAQKSKAWLFVWVCWTCAAFQNHILMSCQASISFENTSPKSFCVHLMSFHGVRCVRPWPYSCITLVSHLLLLWFLSPITFEARCHLWISSKRTSSFVCSSVIAWAWTSAPSTKQGVRIGAMELVASLKHGPFCGTFSKHHPHKGKSSTGWLEDLSIVYHHTSYHDEKLSLHKPTSTSLDTAQLPWDKKQGTVGRGTGCLGGGYSRPEKKQNLRWQIPSRKQKLPRMDGKCNKSNQFSYKYYSIFMSSSWCNK